MNLLLTSNGLTSKKMIDTIKDMVKKPLIKIKIIMLSSGPRSKKVLKYIKGFKKTFS